MHGLTRPSFKSTVIVKVCEELDLSEELLPQKTVGRLLTNSWPTVGRLLTDSRPTVVYRLLRKFSANSRPTVRSLSRMLMGEPNSQLPTNFG